MAFTKSPYRLSRIQSLRVLSDFPAKLAEASKRAGVPNGVLLDRLVDQYLESDADDDGLTAIAKLAEARERVRELNQILGVGITIEQLNIAMADGVASVDETRQRSAAEVAVDVGIATITKAAKYPETVLQTDEPLTSKDGTDDDDGPHMIESGDSSTDPVEGFWSGDHEGD